MEIKFEQRSCRYLKCLTDQIQQREQTQEVRLPEDLPDIGRVIGCSGQMILRGKQWRKGSMEISGGIMARVLYAPEEGGVCAVETWIPIQIKWALPDTDRDGFILVQPLLQGLDARSISARKLMTRATVSIRGLALETGEQILHTPAAVPQDVQLLRQTYPMELPKEFGEKNFRVEEELTPPEGLTDPGKILSLRLTPDITEEKIVGGRLVFRGEMDVSMMYLDNGVNRTWQTRIPFAQFADLDTDFSEHASVRIIPVLTDGEVEQQDAQWILKAGVTAQWLLYDREMVTLTEDAYSTLRPVELQTEHLQLQPRLQQQFLETGATCVIPAEARSVVELMLTREHPRWDREQSQVILDGTVTVLYEDMDGAIQSGTGSFTQTLPLVADEDASVDLTGLLAEPPVATVSADKIEITVPLKVEAQLYGGKGLPMIHGLSLGPEQQPDPARPSLILRRCGDQDLWTIAKESGSTVDAISRANGLEGEPLCDRLLLIPVI